MTDGARVPEHNPEATQAKVSLGRKVPEAVHVCFSVSPVFFIVLPSYIASYYGLLLYTPPKHI